MQATDIATSCASSSGCSEHDDYMSSYGRGSLLKILGIWVGFFK